MLAGTDQIQILSFDLIHHGVHLCKGHNTGHHIAADHKRRNAVGKTAVDHKITCVGNYSGMQSCNIPHQIIKSIACHSACSIQVDAVKTCHNIRMIGDLKVRNYRLAEPLNLHVLAVILSDGHAGIDDIGNGHHDLAHSGL